MKKAAALCRKCHVAVRRPAIRRGDGQIKFYKGGYTEIRGRFDYASLSTNDIETAQRFSILILSDDL